MWLSQLASILARILTSTWISEMWRNDSGRPVSLPGLGIKTMSTSLIEEGKEDISNMCL